MRNFSNLLFTSLILIVVACGSKVPIADVSQAVVNDRLLGKWTTLEQDKDEYIEFSLLTP